MVFYIMGSLVTTALVRPIFVLVIGVVAVLFGFLQM
jgi:hypothetical protein